MADAERRRLSPRRGARRAQPPPPNAPRRAAGIPVTRLGLLVLLLIGYWLGRFAAFVPSDGLRVIDVVIAVVSAVALALWYRRRAREYMRLRAEERARRSR